VITTMRTFPSGVFRITTISQIAVEWPKGQSTLHFGEGSLFRVVVAARRYGSLGIAYCILAMFV
jgi:hypothetical protein